jgi:hypothetical protein
MQAITFRSKIDRWLAAVIVGAAIASLGTVVAVAIAASLLLALTLGPLIFLIAGALPLWVLTATSYTLDASDLHVRSGPFRWKVPLREIRGIAPTRSALSSPALSLDRLRIDFGGRWIMVSPDDKDRFLAELRQRSQRERQAVGGEMR